jgi:hypothetical protein
MQEGPFPFHVPLYRASYNSREFFSGYPPKYLRKQYLEILKDDYTGHEILTVLQVALIYAQRWDQVLTTSIFELMISKGANINLCSLTGFSPLNTLLNYRTRGSVPWSENRKEYLHLLLINGAHADVSQCAVTPLQSAILGGVASRMNPDFDDRYRAIETLLKRGARPNTVSNDDANIARIRHTCSILFLRSEQCSSVWLDEFEYIKLALRDRGTSYFYDTPLRILENQES